MFNLPTSTTGALTFSKFYLQYDLAVSFLYSSLLFYLSFSFSYFLLSFLFLCPPCFLVQGPRVIVVGPTDSGKSTLSRMLLSWAAKQGWKPTFVDIDIGQGSITIPGCIAGTPIEVPIDPVEGIPLEMPLVFFQGHTTPRSI